MFSHIYLANLDLLHISKFCRLYDEIFVMREEFVWTLDFNLHIVHVLVRFIFLDCYVARNLRFSSFQRYVVSSRVLWVPECWFMNLLNGYSSKTMNLTFASGFYEGAVFWSFFWQHGRSWVRGFHNLHIFAALNLAVWEVTGRNDKTSPEGYIHYVSSGQCKLTAWWQWPGFYGKRTTGLCCDENVMFRARRIDDLICYRNHRFFVCIICKLFSIFTSVVLLMTTLSSEFRGFALLL